jgi:hypothetical protein
MGIQKTILWLQVRIISHNLSKLHFLYVDLLHTVLYEVAFMAIVETFNNYALFEVLTAVTMKTSIFWDVTLCSLVEIC